MDLAERQQGDLLGRRQHGSAEIRIARFPDDNELLQRARGMAQNLLGKDPALEGKGTLPLRGRALSRHPRGEQLFRVG